jgi:hypothetical protein
MDERGCDSVPLGVTSGSKRSGDVVLPVGVWGTARALPPLRDGGGVASCPRKPCGSSSPSYNPRRRRLLGCDCGALYMGELRNEFSYFRRSLRSCVGGGVSN